MAPRRRRLRTRDVTAARQARPGVRADRGKPGRPRQGRGCRRARAAGWRAPRSPVRGTVCGCPAIAARLRTQPGTSCCHPNPRPAPRLRASARNKDAAKRNSDKLPVRKYGDLSPVASKRYRPGPGQGSSSQPTGPLPWIKITQVQVNRGPVEPGEETGAAMEAGVALAGACEFLDPRPLKVMVWRSRVPSLTFTDQDIPAPADPVAPARRSVTWPRTCPSR